MTARPRAALEALVPYSAGRGPDTVRRELGLKGHIIKLASNEGAFGPLAVAEKAMAAALRQANRYPEAGFGRLREGLAQRHGVSTDRVLVGAGLCAIIHHLSMAFAGPGDEVAFCSPTFTAYRLEALKMGAVPIAAQLTPDGAFDMDALAAAITERTKLIYVTSPNNPTGNIVPRRDLSAFLKAVPPTVLVVLDEAYFEYVDHPDSADGIREFVGADSQVVVMRTFSKIYGLAGLRIGYAICPAPVVEACMKVQNPFEVNNVAQAAALASLNDEAELRLRQAENRVARDRLVEGLRAMDYEPPPAHGNFVRIAVQDGAATARELEREGVIVRPLGSMGDPKAIRVTVGTTDEVDYFLRSFKRVSRQIA